MGRWVTLENGEHAYIGGDGKAYYGNEGIKVQRTELASKSKTGSDGVFRPTDGDLKAKVVAASIKQKHEFSGESRERVQSYIDRTLGLKGKTPEEVASIVVPPNGPFDKIEIDVNRLEGGLRVIGTSSKYPDVSMEGHIRMNDVGTNKGLILHQDYLALPEALQGKGLGVSLFASQVESARKLGIKGVELQADRSAKHNGYYTWPRFGFDAPLVLTFGTRSTLPKSLSTAKRVSDLMATQEGRDWWKKNGQTTNMSFDLHPKSPNSMILSRYLKEKGK